MPDVIATPADVLAALQPLFRDILDVPDLQLTASMSAKDVDEWDSLNHIRLISGIEQHFKVRLTSADVERLTCVGDMANLVAAKLH
jgi:acyl carrier protein